jgi:hypothetical protein
VQRETSRAETAGAGDDGPLPPVLEHVEGAIADAAALPAAGRIIAAERCADVIASGADLLWSPEPQRPPEDEPGHADVRDAITRGLAILACRPGGAAFGGMHWCRSPHEDCPGRGTLSLPGLESRAARGVWLGVSAEDQKWAGIRIPALMATPAAVRFVSAEPLLGWIDLAFDRECGDPPHLYCPEVPDWIIVGGESGPGARPMELAWAREIVGQCRQAGIAPFVKQIGSVRGRELGAGPKGGDWDDWPADLRVREFPHESDAA